MCECAGHSMACALHAGLAVPLSVPRSTVPASLLFIECHRDDAGWKHHCGVQPCRADHCGAPVRTWCVLGGKYPRQPAFWHSGNAGSHDSMCIAERTGVQHWCWRSHRYPRSAAPRCAVVRQWAQVVQARCSKIRYRMDRRPYFCRHLRESLIIIQFSSHL